MICNLTIGATVIELAGGNGRESETSGLRIDTETNFERVAYLGVTDGRQFARPGSYVSASFSSIQTFSTVQAAETYVLGLPADLADQSGAEAELGREVDSIIIGGTLTDGTDPVVFPELPRIADFGGKAQYSDDAGLGLVYWDSPYWIIEWNGDVYSVWRSTENVALPSTVSTWTAVSPATGTPTVTNSTVITPSLTIYDAQANVSASHRGCAVTLDVQISGRLTAP
jgi:hypothetical protein